MPVDCRADLKYEHNGITNEKDHSMLVASKWNDLFVCISVMCDLLIVVPE